MDLQVHALVLRRIPYGDTSAILHVFSRELGRMSIISKGLRRPKSRMDPVLQTGNLAVLQLYFREGRDLQLLKDADLKEDFRGLRRDYNRLLTGMAICEAVERTQLADQPDAVLFDTVVLALRLAASDCPRPVNLLYWFLLFLLSHSGYGLDIEACAVCGRPWEEFRRLSGGTLDLSLGRARCPDCPTGGQDAGVSPALWRVLRFLLVSPPEVVASREITLATRQVLAELLEQLLRMHMADGLELRGLRQSVEMDTTQPSSGEDHGSEDE